MTLQTTSKLQNEKGLVIPSGSIRLLMAEYFALDEAMYQRAEAVVILGCGFSNGIDSRLVDGAGGFAG